MMLTRICTPLKTPRWQSHFPPLFIRFPITLDGIQTHDPTLQPRWRRWGNEREVLISSYGHYAFINDGQKNVSLYPNLPVWDLQRGEHVCTVLFTWDVQNTREHYFSVRSTHRVCRVYIRISVYLEWSMSVDMIRDNACLSFAKWIPAGTLISKRSLWRPFRSSVVGIPSLCSSTVANSSSWNQIKVTMESAAEKAWKSLIILTSFHPIAGGFAIGEDWGDLDTGLVGT